MNTVQKQNLLNVAKALREYAAAHPKREQPFAMHLFVHPCGTPACALGHYAVRTDLQGAFVLKQGKDTLDNKTYSWIEPVRAVVIRYEAQEEFGIDDEEYDELFSGDTGCNGARTEIEAAEYIERFVAEVEARR